MLIACRYIFQDLVTAGDLFSYLELRNGKLLNIEVAVIVRQILIALVFLHGKNIVHRDLKPENILMTALAIGCRVVLTDFGCARIVQHETTRMSTNVGTYEFTAPFVTFTLDQTIANMNAVRPCNQKGTANQEAATQKLLIYGPWAA